MCKNIGWYFKNNTSGPVMTSGDPIVIIVIQEIDNKMVYVKRSAEPAVITVCRMSEAPIWDKHC